MGKTPSLQRVETVCTSNNRNFKEPQQCTEDKETPYHNPTSMILPCSRLILDLALQLFMISFPSKAQPELDSLFFVRSDAIQCDLLIHTFARCGTRPTNLNVLSAYDELTRGATTTGWHRHTQSTDTEQFFALS
eukprot:3569117-Amphidinium_carterae.1